MVGTRCQDLVGNFCQSRLVRASLSVKKLDNVAASCCLTTQHLFTITIITMSDYWKARGPEKVTSHRCHYSVKHLGEMLSGASRSEIAIAVADCIAIG